MNHDDDARRQPPAGIAAYRGNGVCINMMCGRCHQPRPQLGSKRMKRGGTFVAICKQCVQEMAEKGAQ